MWPESWAGMEDPVCPMIRDENEIFLPTMPTTREKFEHRDKMPKWPVYAACVARSVTKDEVRRTPRAQEALGKEWTRLRDIKTWDETIVRERRSVEAEARRKGLTMHFGRIFAICVEKGSELPESDPSRKYKGRAVFQGNNVRDQNFDVALFQDLGSSPATMEAGKAADAYGLLPGNATQQADATQAYTQSKLGGYRHGCPSRRKNGRLLGLA